MDSEEAVESIDVTTLSITERLMRVQAELVVPKTRWDDFGKYHYRSGEDIISAAKPLCHKYGMALLFKFSSYDENGWHYIVATAWVTDGKEYVETQACMRQPESKKGVDASQVSGGASSFAMKYALQGLFAIDDGVEPDSAFQGIAKPTPPPVGIAPQQYQSPKQTAWGLVMEACYGDREQATAWFESYRSRDDFDDCDGFWAARVVELLAGRDV